MAKVQRVTIFKTNVGHQPGSVLSVMQKLKAKGIGLTCMWGFEKRSGDAELHLLPKNPDKLRTAWKATGVLAEEYAAFFIKGTDSTGVLVKYLDALAGAGVSMEALQAVAVGGKYGAIIWVNSADVEKAAAALSAK